MAGYWQILRSFSPSLKRYFCSTAMATTAAFGILAVLQSLYILRLGFDPQFIGLLLGSGQFVWALAALPAGYVIGHIGLLNGWRFGLILTAVMLVLMLQVEALPRDLWPAWLLGCQALMQVGTAFITVSIPPYLMYVTGEHDRRHAFAVFQASIPATAFIGSMIAGWLPVLFAGQFDMTLEQAAPYRLALWMAPLLYLLALLPIWGMPSGKPAEQESHHAPTERAPFTLLAFFGLLVYLVAISEGVVRTFFNVYLDAGLAVPATQIGFVMGVAQLLPIGAALLAPILMTRWGTGYALAIAILGTAAALLLLAVAPGLWLVALAYMAIIAAVTITSTARDVMGQEMVAVKWRTTIAGVAMVGLALGWSTAGVVGGYLVDARGYSALFFAAMLSSLFAFALLFGYLRTRRKPTTAEAIGRALSES